MFDVFTWQFGPQRDDDFVLLWGAYCGEIVGRVIELRRDGRSAEIGQFWSSKLEIVPVLILMTIAGLVGDHFFGILGRYLGIVGVPVLFALANEFRRRVLVRLP
jgi:hypothetical protein